MSSPASLWEKLHELWQHLPLRGMGLLTAALPMGAVMFSASLAFVGNEQRERTETALKHHIELVEGLGQLSALMLNAETGLRGYLLSQQAEFLAPYELEHFTLICSRLVGGSAEHYACDFIGPAGTDFGGLRARGQHASAGR